MEARWSRRHRAGIRSPRIQCGGDARVLHPQIRPVFHPSRLLLTSHPHHEPFHRPATACPGARVRDRLGGHRGCPCRSQPRTCDRRRRQRGDASPAQHRHQHAPRSHFDLFVPRRKAFLG
ncbi:hypothetical protein, variant [Aphanomyces astaci]|uniref:Uncharacterized protein n=1 Tax=Aphanomyces astaci TaxID=112090 RepID=W4FKS0_APHAT|nr:hypothetical protein, variant [Aphanomyces astaci]ETV67439.1 hypothetical protein, variant [Aphanomyces astaci]|eukprot:XP_009842998.1 hypothetical protein, variant [Aphanomyces astaci]